MITSVTVEKLEKQLSELKIAARHLATEADNYVNCEGDAMELADAISKVEKLTLGENA